MRELVLLRVGILDVADRALGLLDVVGNALVALGADADGPLDGGRRADLGLEVAVHFGEVVREHGRGARAVRTTHDGNGLRGQLRVRVQLGDRGVIPLGDGAEEDLRQRVAVEDEGARGHAFEVHDRHDAAHDHRELDEAVLLELFTLERRVGCAEGHRLGLDLLDAAARADRLVVETDVGLFFVGVRPLRIDRVGEARTGARDVGGQSKANASCDSGCRKGAARESDQSGPHYWVLTFFAAGGSGRSPEPLARMRARKTPPM